MAIRIRVYPSYANPAMTGRYGAGVVNANTLYATQLAQSKRLANTQLTYERALWNERIQRARLEERMQSGMYGYGGMPMPVPMPVPVPYGLGARTIAPGFGLGMPLGAGQINLVNQTSTGGNQRVTNTNSHVSNHRVMSPHLPYQHPDMPWGGMPFGGGGLLSGLLGALI